MAVIIRCVDYLPTFINQLRKLSPEIRASAKEAMRGLEQHPMPGWIRFEKLSGYKNPCIYTIHVTRNHSHKISFEIQGDKAIFRRIATHKEIDRNPK